MEIIIKEHEIDIKDIKDKEISIEKLLDFIARIKKESKDYGYIR